MNKTKGVKKIVWGFISALFLAVIGNGIWELFAKPGLTKCNRIILNVITLGSAKIRDAAYASAALDPTPLASLQIILLVSTLPLALAVLLFLVEFGGPIIEEKIDAIVDELIRENKDEKDKKIRDARIREGLRSLKRKASLALISVTLVISIAGLVGVKILNQALLVYRTYQADMDICGPYMTFTEEKMLRARFASVKSREDYVQIHHSLEKLASKNGTKLNDIDLW